MPGETTILTALGLDLTQFERGVGAATNTMRQLAHGAEMVDSSLRGIPLLGRIYAGTLGKIVDGFAATNIEAREFARIMEVDVSKSLHSSISQIDEITEAIKGMQAVTWGRSIADFFTVLSTRGRVDPGADRDKAVLALEQRRQTLILKSVELMGEEAQSQSAIVAGSELDSQLTRIRLEFEEKIARAKQEAQRQGGPNWRTQDAIVERLNAQKTLYGEIAERERNLAMSRHTANMAQSVYAVRAAELQYKGNERDIAAEEIKLALRKEDLALKFGTAEDQQSAIADRKIAEARAKSTQIEYDKQVKQSKLQTDVMLLEATGQTRAANQAKIRLQYEVAISDELRKGNTELAKSLSQQQRIAQFQEALRLYEMGGKGRSEARREEAKHRRAARTVEKREASREANEVRKGFGGLTNHPGLVHAKPKEAIGGQAFNAKEFADRLFSILSK